MDKPDKISDDVLEVSFANNQYRQSLKSYKHVLDFYKKGHLNALELKSNIPIFLDTNVLLSVYEVSFKAREKIKQFVTNYKDKIVLTNQVQHEYIKNREKVINTFQTTVTEQIPRNFKNEVVNKFSTFKNANKSKLEDYTEIQEQLEKLEKSIEILSQKISEKVDDKKDTAQTLLLEDDFLDILSSLKTTDEFSDKFLKQISSDYDILLPKFKETQNLKDDDDDKNSTRENFSLTVFPGCGEKGNKDDPKGDFIIFHELMQYAKKYKTDIVFLTNDTTKGDWLRKDGKIHVHYLENFYKNTNQLIYIFNAERLFANLFKNISFKSLVPITSDTGNMSIDLIYEFLESYKPFEKFETPTSKREIFVKELQINGINNIIELQTLLDSGESIIPLIVKDKPFLNKVGAMRVCLNVVKDDFIRISSKGEPEQSEKNLEYDRLRKIWQSLNE